MGLKSIFGKSGNKELSEQGKWDALQKAQSSAFQDAHERLFTAIRKEKLPEIDRILAEYPEAKDWKDREGEKGRPLLHYALQKNCLKSFTHMLDSGVSVSKNYSYVYDVDWFDYDSIRYTHKASFDALEAACLKQKKDFVFACLQRIEKPSIRGHAHRKNHPEIENYISNAADIYRDFQEKKSLSYALDAEKKAEEKLKHEQEALDKLKKSFFDAIKSGDLVTIENTIGKHPEALNWKEKDHDIECLFYAMETKNIESFRALIHLGADINKKINTPGNGAYPIHYAVAKNLEDFLTILLQRGADTSKRCGWGDMTHKLRPELGADAQPLIIARDLKYTGIISILDNAKEIRADYLAAHKDAVIKQKEKPAKPTTAPANTQTATPIGPDALQVILKEFADLKKMMGEFNSLKEKQAETEKQLAETRRELEEMKDPGNIVKLPRKEM